MNLLVDSASTFGPVLQNRLTETSESVGSQLPVPPGGPARQKLLVRFINDNFPVSISVKGSGTRQIGKRIPAAE